MDHPLQMQVSVAWADHPVVNHTGKLMVRLSFDHRKLSPSEPMTVRLVVNSTRVAATPTWAVVCLDDQMSQDSQEVEFSITANEPGEANLLVSAIYGNEPVLRSGASFLISDPREAA
jgi:hypothetical protein